MSSARGEIVEAGCGKDLDRDVAIQLLVAGAIHLAHTASRNETLSIQTRTNCDFTRAMLGSRVLTGVLYGLSPADPLTFAAALIVLLAAAAGAVVLPTRRAAAVDPATVLREV